MLFFLVAVVFGIQLLGNYVGEEAVYTLTSLEMWFRGEWILPTQYGKFYDRPPMFNWPMILLANALGWEHVLFASRFIAVSATLVTAAVLWLLASDLTENTEFAFLAVLTYLSGDLLFVRGWLAYADPLFSLFVFSSIAGLHFAVKKRSAALLTIAVIALSCAFLTKAVTAYVFYGTALLVLFARRQNRSFLLRPTVILIHVGALLFPFYWFVSVSQGLHGPQMVNAIFEKFENFTLGAYLGRLVIYPIQTLALFLPTSFIAVALIARRKVTPVLLADPDIRLWMWILLLSTIPYWLAPEGAGRYLLPTYPLFALLFTTIVWSYGPLAVRTTVRWLTAGIVLGFLWAIWLMPYYQMNFRGGDYAAVAERIVAIVGNRHLATNDVSATGLSVTAELNKRRHPMPPLEHPVPEQPDGFVINYTPDRNIGEVVEHFEFARNSLYLLCRGDACNGSTTDQD
jgi:4-amino-4-deoxy-L-arabinose transferase-like glycosyltransferase